MANMRRGSNHHADSMCAPAVQSAANRLGTNAVTRAAAIVSRTIINGRSVRPPPPPLGGSVVVNVRALDVPPPGVGLDTVMLAEPAVATSPAGTVAVSEVGDTMVVVNGLPFHWTAEFDVNPAPLTVSTKPPLPAGMEAGDSEDAVGRGLVNVRVAPAEVPLPGGG